MTTAVRSLLVAAALLAVPGALASVPSSSRAGGGGGPLVVTGAVRIAGFPVQQTAARAIAVFGAPTAVTSRRTSRSSPGGPFACRLSWRELGLTMTFAHFAAGRCVRGSEAFLGSSFTDAVVTGARWRTDRALEVGSTKAEMIRLYPRAAQRPRTRYGHEWWLVPRVYHNDCAARPPMPYPGLAARLARGRVSTLVVHYLFCE